MPGYVAVDLGAESGRVIRGDLDSGRLRLEPLTRFSTGTVKRDGHLRWDLPRFLERIADGLRAAAARGSVDGIGVDAWGVDFGLLGDDEELLELPVAYRDPRTEGMAKRFFQRVPRSEIYRRTGIQFLPFNTLYQLLALKESGTPVLAGAHHLLMIPDLILHHLCGVRSTEFTNATTTQCLNAETRAWDHNLLQAVGIDPDLMQHLVTPGTVLGPLKAPLAKATGLGAVPVIAPATHDTASAVAAIPARGEDWAYLSSGTWSLLGIETLEPVITEHARERNLTNEGGVEGTNRLLRNIMGLWLVQRLRADFGSETTYDEMIRLAEEAPPSTSVVDPDDPRFLDPPSMADAFGQACREAGEPVPESPGAFVRGALSSLALRYRQVLEDLRLVTGREIRCLHVVGGGARNRLLNQLTADATGLPVLAGPVEATAIGNLLMQARARGRLSSLAELREVVQRSFETRITEPRENEPLEKAWERFPGKGAG